jgi:hypothetical protein
LSDRQIATHCGVHHHTVGRIRAELEQSGVVDSSGERTVHRGALAYALNVEALRRSNRSRSLAAADNYQSRASSPPASQRIPARDRAELGAASARTDHTPGRTNQGEVSRALERARKHLTGALTQLEEALGRDSLGAAAIQTRCDAHDKLHCMVVGLRGTLNQLESLVASAPPPVLAARSVGAHC